MISLCPDNTATNFGGQRRGGTNNVFFLMKENEEFSSISGVGFSSHILHNMARTASSKCRPYNFETIANSIVGHFSNHMGRWQEFCDIALELNVPTNRFPKHTSVRWLSLGNLCLAISKKWPAIESYFRSIDETPAYLSEIFQEDRFEKSQEYSAVFSFAAFSLGKFNEANAKTQSLTLTIPELVSHIADFRKRLQAYHSESQFGHETDLILEQMEQDALHMAVHNLRVCFQKFYLDALNYLDKWIGFLRDFDGLEWMIFKEELSFNKVKPHYIKYCSDDSVALDKLFDEIIEAKELISTLQATAFSG